jgi:hypothetical protein
MAKRNLKLDLDGLLDVMKEAYRDCDEQKKGILENLSTASKRKTGDFADEMDLARVINDTRKVLNDVIEKKIKLITIHTKLITATTKTNEEGKVESGKMITLSQEEIKNLRAELKKDIKDSISYDLT